METKNKYYIALIGDMIDSKKIKNREEVQNQFLSAFEKIHQQYERQIVSKFTITVGDEFQALLLPNAGVWQLMDHLSILSPKPFRVGLGLGKISTQINPNLSLGADGEAYWHAREAIQLVHKDNWGGKSHILFKGPSEKEDQLINSLILASETIKTGWSQLQKETFAKLVANDIYQPHFAQNEMAEHLEISAQALSKRLIAGNIKIYFQIRQTLGQLLEDYHDRAKRL